VNRRALLALPVAIALTAPACASRGALHTRGDEAHRIAGVWWLMFALAAVVYAVVAMFIVVAVVRRGPSRANEHAFIWIGGIAAPLAILLLLAGVTVQASTHLRKPAKGALTVEVTGYRWWWRVRYPGTPVETANEIHLPVGRPVHLVLTTADVVHSFWVPELAGKVDTIPGQENPLDFTVTKPGRYRGQCAEYCGVQHAHMGVLVIGESRAAFNRWLVRQAQPAVTPTDDLIARGQLVFTTQPCAGCHTIRGTDARGDVGPDLTKVGSRRTLAALTIPNDVAHLSGWIINAQTEKPGALMPPLTLSPADLRALVAYLESLT
jgi:cytochrome c oxidase subunit 2